MGVVVLIVDDDDAVRFFHRIIVAQNKLSAEPLSFRTGKEALDYLDEYCNDEDTYLILLDINMPVINGWDVLDIISNKSYHQQVYIVMITSSVEKEDREKAKSYDMIIDVVEKPISDEDCKSIMSFSRLSQHPKTLQKRDRT